MVVVDVIVIEGEIFGFSVLGVCVIFVGLLVIGLVYSLIFRDVRLY